MGKAKSYPDGYEAQKLFMEKYGDVIGSLKRMPRNTEEEKDARYSFFRQHQTDEMLLLLFQAVKPGKAENQKDGSELENSDRYNDLLIFGASCENSEDGKLPLGSYIADPDADTVQKCSHAAVGKMV